MSLIHVYFWSFQMHFLYLLNPICHCVLSKHGFVSRMDLHILVLSCFAESVGHVADFGMPHVALSIGC